MSYTKFYSDTFLFSWRGKTEVYTTPEITSYLMNPFQISNGEIPVLI
jgi:hypothetical protein